MRLYWLLLGVLLCVSQSGCLVAVPAVAVAASSASSSGGYYQDSEVKPWYNPKKTREEAIQDANECWAIAIKQTVERGMEHRKAYYEVETFGSLMRQRHYKQIRPDDVPHWAATEKVGHAQVMFRRQDSAAKTG